MRGIFEKYRSYLLTSSELVYDLTPSQIRHTLSLIEQSEQGTVFSDIDYSNGNRAAWTPCLHVKRANELAAAYVLGLEKVDVSTLLSLLDTWLKLDPICPNWWYNMIGVPRELSSLAMIIWDEIPCDMQKLVLSRLSRGVIFHKFRGVHESGANLLWLSDITMRYAFLASDPYVLGVSVKLAEGETECKTEGIQPDGSFFQHGRMLYSGGYGRSFIHSIVPMILAVDSTPYAFSPESLERLSKFVTSLKYMTHRGYIDLSALGREYVREDALLAGSLIPDIDLMLKCREFPREQELSALRNALEDKTPSFDGVHYFPDAHYLSLSFGDVFVSFSGISPTLLGSEIINDENFLGYNLSYGTHTSVMNKGNEYSNISGVWDYALIPGTSVPYFTTEELKTKDFLKRFLSEIEDFGGWQDGDTAACFVTTRHEGVSATVSAFATPYGMILLGNSLCDSDSREIITTVEQCIVTGDIRADEREVVHGGVKYTNLTDGARFTVKDEIKQGNKRKNRMSNPDEPCEGRILTVTLDRGGESSYAYAISPASVDASLITVVENDGMRQSIRLPDGRVLRARK